MMNSFVYLPVMPRKPSNQPTEVELAILRVLWERGPSSVRQVHNALKSTRDTGYSTTLKMIQVMFEKRLLIRDESERPQIYQVAQPAEKTRYDLVDHLIQKVFGGSVQNLVLSAVRGSNSKEVLEIRKLLQKMGK
jgi:BlaI family penicillinase repressor